MAPTLAQIARAPVAAIDFANILLTTQDATIGASPKDVVWTHRTTTLYRYRSNLRTKPVPVLLVFALINRPDIFDLRPGQLVRGVPPRRGLRRLPRRLGRARRRGPRRRSGLLRLRRPALGDARGPARERPGRAEPRRLVHRRRARGDARRDRPGQPGTQPRPAHDAGRHERLAVRQVGRATGLRRRLRRRHARGRPRRGRRRHEQDDEAGHELLDDVPDPLDPGPGGDGAARGLPDDGEVGGEQPALRRPRVPRVDRGDVPAQPARRGHACACAASGSTCATSSRTCSS